jgi:hypothetical protein
MMVRRWPQAPIEYRNPTEARVSPRLYPVVLDGPNYDVGPAQPARSDKRRLSRSFGGQKIETDYRDTPEEILCSDVFLGHHGIRSTRQELLPLLARCNLRLSGTVALASQIDPSETETTLPDAIRWSGWINSFPPHNGVVATLHGGLDKLGHHCVLMKWYPPGYMSVPYTYATDRCAARRTDPAL